MPTEGPAEANSASQTASSQIQIDVLDNGGQLTCNSGRRRSTDVNGEDAFKPRQSEPDMGLRDVPGCSGITAITVQQDRNDGA